jgi:hypothetical protein
MQEKLEYGLYQLPYGMGILGKPRPQVDFPVILDSKCLITTITEYNIFVDTLRYYLKNAKF